MKPMTLMRFCQRVRMPKGVVFLLIWLFCTLLAATATLPTTPGAGPAHGQGQTAELSTSSLPLQTMPAATPAEDGGAITTIAWGDVDNDRQLDLAVGYEDGTVRIWRNRSAWDQLRAAGAITHVRSVAWGDMDGDTDLDLAVGGDGGVVIYENRQGDLKFDAGQKLGWSWHVGSPATHSVAWGDLDSNEKLDLAVGNFQSETLVFQQDDVEKFKLAWRSDTMSNTTAVAWGYYNADYLLDLAVANSMQQSVVYQNTNGEDNQWFKLVWSSQKTPLVDTRSIAWGDFNRDAWPDLALGNQGAPNQVFQNSATGLAEVGIEIATAAHQTTSIAWGNSDDDGALELAVGNLGQPSHVYEYSNGKFQPIWSSEAIPNAHAIAWGDWNSDGDLDLTVAGDANPTLGVYANVGGEAGSPLVFADRPGRTGNAYFYSAAEILGGPPNQNLEFTYALLGSDEKQDLCYYYVDQDRDIKIELTPTPAPPLSLFGYTWYTVTFSSLQDLGTIPGTTIPAHMISDHARIQVNRLCRGATGSTGFTAISPPFRVRATTCIWPEAPLIRAVPQVDDPASFQFTGQIMAGSGLITYTWEFGDGFAAMGQRVTHRYRTIGPYSVKLTVKGKPCPANRPRFATATVLVGAPNLVFLPWVAQSESAVAAAGDTIMDEAMAQHPPTPDSVPSPGALPQILGLTGRGGDTTILTWQPPQDQSVIHGYRVYRFSLTTVDGVELLAELPPDVTQYNDQASHCGNAYYVTTFADDRESDASLTTYYGLPCPSE